MDNYVEQIRLPLVNNYIKIIKSLADYGRNYYHKYLVLPLSVWSKSENNTDINSLISKIRKCEEKGDLSNIAALYKETIVKSVSKNQLDLSIPGNIALSFLKVIKENADIAYSEEALQFINLLYKPFRDFSDFQFKKANRRFEEEIESIPEDQFKELAEITRKHADDIEKERKLSDSLIREFQQSVKDKAPFQVKKDIMSYLLRVSTPKDPNLHKSIYPMIDSIEYMHKGFRKDIMDSVAVLIYHEVVKCIRSGQIKKALLYISKYIVLFRGDPSTPNYDEIDMFEKSFFDLIEKRNLWDSI
ncbi:MAG: hypothetical protein JW982_13165 [Spirochaetes bacterium]|nr:hypothetical protein [Spirochaetota bacterium]